MDHRPWALAFSAAHSPRHARARRHRAEGISAERGHVAAERIDRDRAGHVVRRDDRSIRSSSPTSCRRIRTSRASCRRSARADAIADDQSGTPLHAPEGSVRALARCRRRRARAHHEALGGAGHARLHHEPAADQHRRPLEQEPVPVHAAGHRHRHAVPLRGDHGAEDARAPGSRRRHSDLQIKNPQVRSTSIATAHPRSASPPTRSRTRSTMRTARGRSRRSTRPTISTGW